MRRARVGVLALVACVGCGSPPPIDQGSTGSQAQQAPIETRQEATAMRVADSLAKGAFVDAEKTFSSTFASKLSAKDLGAFWTRKHAALGKHVRSEPATRSPESSTERGSMWVVRMRFEQGITIVRVAFEPHGDAVTGLFFQPAPPKGDELLPPYAQAGSFEAREVAVGSDSKLPATLTLPKGAKAAPAIVLVHNAGPADRDATLGRSTPFRDLALGLASKGVAVLRYEKRTLPPHAASLAALGEKLTVDDEVTKDAVSAVALLKKTAEIDPKRVFVAGLGFGGFLAPRIAAVSNAAGLVSLAGGGRPFEDVAADHEERLARATRKPAAEIAAIAESGKKRAALAKSKDLGPTTPKSELPLGLPAPYWLSLRGYDAPAEAAKLGRPVLVVHAGRDDELTGADFDAWQRALEAKPFAKLERFPTLNRLLVAGSGVPSRDDFDLPGHVAPEVIEAIARFVGAADAAEAPAKGAAKAGDKAPKDPKVGGQASPLGERR